MTSLMSEIAEPFCRELADFLSDRLSIPVRFTADADYVTRRQLLDRQQIDIAWICGLLHVQQSATAGWGYHAVAAPVMLGQSRAVYFGEVIVGSKSNIVCLEDLRGAAWAYNETESFSGYQMLRAPLAEMGERGPFFGRGVQSGGHMNSLEFVRSGRVEAAIIDSTVLQMAAANDPALRTDLRVVHRIGPYPAPPIVLSSRLASPMRDGIATALLDLSNLHNGAALLNRHQLKAFAAADDDAYHEIRLLMERTAQFIL